MNTESIRKDFPILRRTINGKQLVYLDSAATSQKPRQVIDAIKSHYENSNANVHRGVHTLSQEATETYEAAHEKCAQFINAGFDEIIFTKNATESINLVAYSLSHSLKKGDEILSTEMEHHSNLVPWQQIALAKGAKIKFAKATEEGLDLEDVKKKITKKTRIVAVTHASNVLGTINPVKEIGELAHSKGAVMLVDGAQSVPHMPVDVKEIGCDFMAFSAHKMLGPDGLGILFGKSELLKNMPPFLFGGDMIREVKLDTTRFNSLPWKFEAGTPNVAGAAGFSAAIDYLASVGMDNIREHEKQLTAYCMKRLGSETDVKIYGPRKRTGLVSFNLGKIHAHDTAALLDQEGIEVRAGHHCAMPLAEKLGITASVRASFYLYNKKQEIDLLASALEKARSVFK
ncbi:cysteine desulfurase [Candidatus Woesearchaeota archaeon]|nr:cysteine desulfurase [Candidatus Woesearchaeota archaeon]